MPIIILRAAARRAVRSVRQLTGAAAVVLMLAGCSPAPSAAPGALITPVEILVEPARLLLRSGDEAQLSAQANDANGHPIGGAEFRFKSTDSRLIRVSPRGLVTSVGPATTGTEVIVSSGPADAHVVVVIVPGSPARLEPVGAARRQVRAGDPDREPLAVRVVDEWGNSVPGAPVTVISDLPQFAGAEINSNSSGLADFSLPRLTRAGAGTLKWAVKGGPSLATVFEVTVIPAMPSSIALISPAPDTTVDAAAAPPQVLPVVSEASFRVTDPFDNPVSDVALLVTATGSEPTSLRTDASGVAKFSIPPNKRFRRIKIVATLPDVPGIERRFDVVVPQSASR